MWKCFWTDRLQDLSGIGWVACIANLKKFCLEGNWKLNLKNLRRNQLDSNICTTSNVNKGEISCTGICLRIHQDIEIRSDSSQLTILII